jgi:hypothetical protein
MSAFDRDRRKCFEKLKQKKNYHFQYSWFHQGLQEGEIRPNWPTLVLKWFLNKFKGDTVYGFLFDYKMDSAPKIIKGFYNVNEVIENWLQYWVIYCCIQEKILALPQWLIFDGN